MYEYIKGTLAQKSPTSAVVDVNGMGYAVHITLNTSEKLPDCGETLVLKTYLHVREDAMLLFGFSDNDEREVFLALLSISGIGPRLAQTILSGMSPEKLAAAVHQNDEHALNAISGVGKKTAQRLIVELKDRLPQTVVPESGRLPEGSAPVADGFNEEALMALMSLGYSKIQAQKAIARVLKQNKTLTIEELVKKALQSV